MNLLKKIFKPKEDGSAPVRIIGLKKTDDFVSSSAQDALLNTFINPPTPQTQQAQALTSIAQSLTTLTTFIEKGGLTTLLQGYSKAQAVGGILQGLTTHAGRQGLDARVLEQDALEIAHKIEAVYEKYQEILSSKKERDPNLVDGEADFQAWLSKQTSQKDS